MQRSLRSILIASAVLGVPQLASASLLVGFHSFNGNANTQSTADVGSTNYALAGYSGTVTKLGADNNFNSSRSTGGSVDGTYGGVTFDANNPPSGTNGVTGGDGFVRSVESTYWDSESNDFVAAHSFPVFRFTQTADGVTQLGQLLFDAATNTATPISGLYVSYLTSSSQTGSKTISSLPNVLDSNTLGSTSYGDYMFDLSGLSLGKNGWIDFTFDGNPYARVDNVGLTNYITPIPEPGSLVALGCLVGSGAFLRTRRRSAAPQLG